MSLADRIPLFAVLIGINEYQCHTHLRGAVADVGLVKHYLESRLGVPSDQIKLLTNGAATRAAIIDALQKLVVDPRIHHDSEDAIVIYFAGHGSEIDAPPGWVCSSPDRKIQAILPCDCDAERPGGRVKAIPDRTIGSLLTKISQKHGINITVILDCCFSTSGTREGQNRLDDEDSMVRMVELDSRDYPDSLDEDIRDDTADTARGISIPSQFAYHGMGSHVLLAACGSKEYSYETRTHPKYGRFTAALMKLLNETSPHLILYSDILPRMDRIEGQNPQCEGSHTDRFLFSGKVLPTSVRKSFGVSYQPEVNGSPGCYTVHAGRIHNITASSKFTVYYETDITLSRPIGILLVVSLGEFHVIAQPPPGASQFDITTGPRGKAMAFPTKFSSAENLQVWIDPAYQFLQDHFARLKTRYADQLENVSLAATQRMSDIEIVQATPEQTISLKIYTSPAILPHSHSSSWRAGGNFLPNDDRLPYTLWQAANFYGELKRADNNPSISQGIDVEFYELQQDIRFGVDDFMTKLKFNLDHGMLTLNMLDPRRREEIPYGIKLTNNTKINLYVNMFCFVNSDLTITPVVKTDQNSPYAVDFPLKKKEKAADGITYPGTLTIGYGDSGYYPLSFTSESDVDVDFLKIYLTTHPVNLSYLQQPSPFDHSTPRRPIPFIQPPVVSWSHIIIPIIQRR